MVKSLFVGYLVLFSLSATALVPVEGILFGEAPKEYQQDPLYHIFNDIYDKSLEGENRKVRLYKNTFDSGVLLQESCGMYNQSAYPTSWMEKQAKRSMVASLQYIGLDTSIKAIGAYAKKLEISEDSFQKLSQNLVKNYCSKNMSIFSLKKLSENLSYYYKNPMTSLIPSVDSSPFATSIFKSKTESAIARSNEFDQAIQNFKSFCSWGGDVADYRLLIPYIKNPFVMSFVIKNLSAIQDKYDNSSNLISQVQSSDTVQVSCDELICRKVSIEDFRKKFPRTIGSSGLYTDLVKLYCHHFRQQDYSTSNTIPQVKTWIKKMELEDPIFETSFFISLMTGVPDPIFGVENYRDLPAVAKSSIDERWNRWANDLLKRFSHDILYEESLKIKAKPRRDVISLRTQGFKLDFTVTLGEMDKVVDDIDKLDATFDIKLSKNYLRHIGTKWNEFTGNIDEEGRKTFRDEVSKYISHQLKGKEKYFRQKMWNDEFSRHIVQELVGQVLAYRGPLFDSLQDEMITIPVNFTFGTFALSYIRYKADVKAGRLKLNL
jgi:hypothetical protein